MLCTVGIIVFASYVSTSPLQDAKLEKKHEELFEHKRQLQLEERARGLQELPEPLSGPDWAQGRSVSEHKRQLQEEERARGLQELPKPLPGPEWAQGRSVAPTETQGSMQERIGFLWKCVISPAACDTWRLWGVFEDIWNFVQDKVMQRDGHPDYCRGLHFVDSCSRGADCCSGCCIPETKHGKFLCSAYTKHCKTMNITVETPLGPKPPNPKPLPTPAPDSGVVIGENFQHNCIRGDARAPETCRSGCCDNIGTCVPDCERSNRPNCVCAGPIPLSKN